jgi:hypothetical protein
LILLMRQMMLKTKPQQLVEVAGVVRPIWLRGQDLNLRLFDPRWSTHRALSSWPQRS